MLSRVRLAALVCLAVAAPAMGDATLTFSPPAVAAGKPSTKTAANGNQFIAYTAALQGLDSWNTALADTLTAQSFTPEFGWLYGNFTNGPTSPVTLANNADFNVQTYRVGGVAGNANQGAVNMQFIFTYGDTKVPTLDGATVTPHWLQLIHENPQTNGFGYSIPALGGGYWQVDNGGVANNSGTAGPFYDSNGAAQGTSVPPKFYDLAGPFDILPGVYVQFWTILSWDVYSGSQHYLVVANQALFWGAYATPEPSSIALTAAGLAVVGASVARSRRVRSAA